MLGPVIFAFFPVIVVLAAVSDLFTMTISNRFSLLLLAGFPVVAMLVPGMTFELAGMHVLTGLLTLAITFTLFAFGTIGGGDAKLAACIALWLGWDLLFTFGFFTAIFGGVLSIALLSFRRLPLPAFAAGQPWIARLYDRREGAPYGIALAASALVCYPHAVWISLAA